MKNKRCAYYLKVNRNEGYTIRNLRHWLETLYECEKNPNIYIVCDNETLIQKIVDTFSGIYSDIESRIMPCIINDETSYIICNVTNERWKMAGYSHITTFIHARDNGYERYWNIDADDTRFCLSPARCARLMEEAKKYAESNHVDCFSLDMHATLIGSGRHWSFGITYTNNTVDWFEIMRKYCRENLDVEDTCPNFDRFFRYIKNQTNEVKIGSFYFENLKFFHYSNDFFWRLSESALFHWKDGYLTLPILYYVIGLQDNKGKMRIDPNVIKLDIQISNDESKISMLSACNTPNAYLKENL